MQVFVRKCIPNMYGEIVYSLQECNVYRLLVTFFSARTIINTEWCQAASGLTLVIISYQSKSSVKYFKLFSIYILWKAIKSGFRAAVQPSMILNVKHEIFKTRLPMLWERGPLFTRANVFVAEYDKEQNDEYDKELKDMLTYGCAWNYSTPLCKAGLLAKFTN